MKITKLKLENIKCFKELDIPFEVDGRIKSWSLIVGNNGQGKTTILRCLAIGLCDKEGASALLAELHGGFLRENEKRGFIEVLLKDENNKEYSIKTIITLEGSNESISQKISPADKNNKLNREDIFAVAYGSGRTMSGTESYEEYAIVDSVYTLFNYEHGLQNAELGARRIKDHAKKQWEKLTGILKEILMLDPSDKVNLEMTGLYIESKWGEVVFDALSDGYQSLTSVVLDFLNWKLLRKEDFNLDKLSGIFILDEIEQHLHPKWQRNIIKILSEKFPNIQFIVTSHSPICALGLSDINEGKDSQLIKASYVNAHSDTQNIDPETLRYHRIDQILISEVFDVDSTRSISISKDYEQYFKLKEKNKLDRNEEKELKILRKKLQALPLWEDLREREMLEALKNALDKND